MNAEKRIEKRDRKNERGAAMVMALLISFLLLVASAGLLLESSTNTQNVTDATAEQQAYNAAESGIQQAVSVLRGNSVPVPLLDATKPATDPANLINFTKALTDATSNHPSDTNGNARLSRWINYNGSGRSRVEMGPGNQFAYDLEITDPDNTGTVVSYETTGRIFDSDVDNQMRRTYGSGGNTVTITYVPTTVTNLDVSSGAAMTNFGSFRVEIRGSGAVIPAFNRFEILTKMTRPYPGRRVIRGFIESGNRTNDQPPLIIFDAQTFTVQGSVVNLQFDWGSPQNVSILGPPQRYGYEARLNNGVSVVRGSMTSPEPKRLLVRSTGFGPRGSSKVLEAIIQKDFFDGLSAPATLTLVGPPSTASPSTTFTFNPGSSNVTVYSGVDAVSTDIIPPIGTINNTNLDVVEESVDGQPPHPFNGTVIGAPTNVSQEMPDWLTSPYNLDVAVRSLYNVANASGRYFPSGTQPTTFGNNATAQGITFCDGNCELSGAGGGIMVVTGTLTLRGNFNFNGLILVTGQGGVTRSGGGNGTIQGNMVIAPYVHSAISDDTNPEPSATFLAPQYDLSGGGNSTIVYNSRSVAGGLVAVSNFVLGIAEK